MVPVQTILIRNHGLFPAPTVGTNTTWSTEAADIEVTAIAASAAKRRLANPSADILEQRTMTLAQAWRTILVDAFPCR